MHTFFPTDFSGGNKAPGLNRTIQSVTVLLTDGVMMNINDFPFCFMSTPLEPPQDV